MNISYGKERKVSSKVGKRGNMKILLQSRVTFSNNFFKVDVSGRFVNSVEITIEYNSLENNILVG